MPLNKEKAQDLIDDFVITNNDELNTISSQNPALFDATLYALNFLSSRFGTSQKMQIVEIPKEQESSLPFKVGDKFNFKTIGSYSNNVILEIDPNKNYFEFENENGSKLNGWSLEEAKQNFASGEWVLIQEISFKVGDIFRKTNSNDKGFKIREIDGDKFVFESLNTGSVSYDLYTTTEANKKLLDGKWEKIKETTKINQAPNFEVGQIIYDSRLGILYEIIETSSLSLLLINGIGNRIVVNKNELAKDISKNDSLLLNFKINDVFTNDNKDIITIYVISKYNSTDVGLKWIENGRLDIVDRNWEIINTDINNGVWKPLLPVQAQTPQNNPYDIKIGDLLFNNNTYRLFEVIDVNSNGVKLMTSNNYKETLDLDKLNKQINDGEKRKLPFSIGNTYVNPMGDFFKIHELYPNNEKSLWVQVNDNPSLDIFQWDIIEDWVDDAYWQPATKGEARQIKADYLQGQQVQPTPTKAPKKTLTKEEKAIKKLQKEIDGLEVLAEFDDEAKQELLVKKQELNVLKAKK